MRIVAFAIYIHSTLLETAIQSNNISAAFDQANEAKTNLGNRVRVQPWTISCTFLHVNDVLYCRLKPLILWPERDVLYNTMSMDFKKHCPRCIVIINCFEIFGATYIFIGKNTDLILI